MSVQQVCISPKHLRASRITRRTSSRRSCESSIYWIDRMMHIWRFREKGRTRFLYSPAPAALFDLSPKSTISNFNVRARTHLFRINAIVHGNHLLTPFPRKNSHKIIVNLRARVCHQYGFCNNCSIDTSWGVLGRIFLCQVRFSIVWQMHEQKYPRHIERHVSDYWNYLNFSYGYNHRKSAHQMRRHSLVWFFSYWQINPPNIKLSFVHI